jgi:hypothetical protein
LSWWVTVCVFVFFMLSFWREKFMRFTTICALAICLAGHAVRAAN